jgi:hypothetical protein
MRKDMKTRTWWKLPVIAAVWAQSAAAQPKEDVIRGIDALSDEYAGHRATDLGLR